MTLTNELKAVLDSIPSGMCVYSVEQGRLYPLYHNPAFFEVLGYTNTHIAQIKEQVTFIGVHEDDRTALERDLAVLLHGGHLLRHTCRIFHDELGEYRWIHIEGSRRADSDEGELLYAVYSDVTEQRRLEQYFQNTLRNLPGGVAVVRYEKDGSIIPEYISEGFAATTEMPLEEAWELYQKDALTGVHPDDLESVRQELSKYLVSGKSHWEIEYRLLKGSGDYVWVKNTLSLIEHEGGERKIYSVYNDMTKEREERARVRQQYNDLLLQHHQRTDPNVLVTGHCNITQDRIIQISDQTGAGLLETFGSVREAFFTGLSTLIVDDKQRQIFCSTYLRVPALAAYERDETKQMNDFFVQFPDEETGRYVRFEMSMVSTPDSDDVTGILTVIDITEQVVADRILHQRSVTGYDFVVDVDLRRDTYTILSQDENAVGIPPHRGVHSRRVAQMLESRGVPRDREQYRDNLDSKRMLERLKQGRVYTFAFSMTDDAGDVRTKNVTVSPIDLRLGRICLSRTDITDSIREQQRLLRVVAYTCELACFIDTATGGLVMYTRQMVLENLPPHTAKSYTAVLDNITGYYEMATDQEAAKNLFRLETLIEQLNEKPGGFDFVLPYQAEEALRYKQVNVLWGDQNHKTVCLVRVDVTDMLATERAAKAEIERALDISREASRAKSDFLSAMSHDIRTPMNAIMGMTTLAKVNIDDPDRIQECLQKISASSSHLMSLINDILDMNRIEGDQIMLNREHVYLPDLVKQVGEIIAPQADQAGLQYEILLCEIQNPYFYGDALRISQILINILGNAVKFTPQGGTVRFLVEELPSKDTKDVYYRFTVSDTGIGMAEETLAHLFEPFVRSRAVSRIEGSGLGLSIVKGLVDLMRGKITVHSELKKGTTFLVELKGEIIPADERRVAPVQQTMDKMDATLFAGRCFLVAEDNQVNAEIICEILRMSGAEVVVRGDGALTVEAYRSTAPGTYDAILMDIQMPEMDGYEAAKTIRADSRPDAKDIPIIAMTANAFEQDVVAALAVGMNAHLAKPIEPEKLFSTLHDYL